MVKVIEKFNTENALIECSCRQRFYIFGVDNPKSCSWGKEYVVKATIREVKPNSSHD
jgi:hypothetical protein